MKKILFLSLLALAACTSAEQVPSIDSSTLPVLQLPDLHPRTLALSVENARQINKDASNAKNVEEAVFDSLASALKKSEVWVKSSGYTKNVEGVVYDSKASVFKKNEVWVKAPENKLHVRIKDCPELQKGIECILLEARFVSANLAPIKWSVAQAHHWKRGNEAGPVIGFGDVTPAYQGAIHRLLVAFEKVLAEAAKEKK